jgi:putative transposase
MQYRRSNAAGATYFFTVNLAQRRNDLLVRHIDVLRDSINATKRAHRFAVVAMVVLPDHLHAIWRLPADDADYPMRWSLIKAGFSRRLEKTETVRASRRAKRERAIWQRRYWEHQIRDDTDLERHVDYIHYNPVKHGLVNRAVEWRFSTLHDYIAKGRGPVDWGGGSGNDADGVYGER